MCSYEYFSTSPFFNVTIREYCYLFCVSWLRNPISSKTLLSKPDQLWFLDFMLHVQIPSALLQTQIIFYSIRVKTYWLVKGWWIIKLFSNPHQQGCVWWWHTAIVSSWYIWFVEVQIRPGSPCQALLGSSLLDRNHTEPGPHALYLSQVQTSS